MSPRKGPADGDEPRREASVSNTPPPEESHSMLSSFVVPPVEPDWYDVPLDDVPAPDEDDPFDSPRSRATPSQAVALVRLARSLYTFLCDEAGTPWAVARALPGVAVPLKGNDDALRTQLAAAYFDATEKTAGSGALADALMTLAGLARRDAPQAVELRAAQVEDSIFIDLGISRDSHVVEVSPSGWRVRSHAPVLFRRTGITRALPVPQRGGSLDAWRPLLNIDEPGFRLLVGWVLAAYIPDIAHPILALYGQQGTAKTSALSQLVRLIDPSSMLTRSMPKEADWAATGNASYVIALDNISGFAPWAQDALCKAVTGEAVAARKMYTDHDLSSVEFRRVLALTSISPGRLQGDVADRLLPVELEPISRFRSEQQVKADFARVHERTLGALLDLLVRVLATLPSVEAPEQARMADFARVLKALDQATGWETLASYLSAHDDAAHAVVESDPFAMAVVQLVQFERVWQGTAAKLLEDLPVPMKVPKTWPTTPRAAVSALKRVIPALTAYGIHARQRARESGTGARGWVLSSTVDVPSASIERTTCTVHSSALLDGICGRCAAGEVAS